MEVGDKVKLMNDVTWHAYSHWSLTLKKPLYIISIDGDMAKIDTVPNPKVDVVNDNVGEGIYMDDLEPLE